MHMQFMFQIALRPQLSSKVFSIKKFRYIRKAANIKQFEKPQNAEVILNDNQNAYSFYLPCL